MKHDKDNSDITPVFAEGTLRPKIVAPPPSYRPQEHSASFILVKLLPGTMEKSMAELKEIQGINGFHKVYGEYDLVLIVRERNKLNKQALMRRIWEIHGVVDVQTLVAAS
ncbi:MAG: Lrp/AsnC ligand binding domain-containing protein [Thermoplasmata archaeon]|nr:MAG: Lrp/AsnC ligand binding domain-containing protein [Thermoplasmata archaeon]